MYEWKHAVDPDVFWSVNNVDPLEMPFKEL